MLFNKNIILEILRSVFSDKIESFVDKCVMGFDEFDLELIFESLVDLVIFNSIEDMIVENFSVEDDDRGQNVFGMFEIVVSLDGFQGDYFVESEMAVLRIEFSFYAEEGKYSDLELEYLY